MLCSLRFCLRDFVIPIKTLMIQRKTYAKKDCEESDENERKATE